MKTPEEILAQLPLYGQTPSCPDAIGMERAFRLTRSLDAAGYVIVPKELPEELRPSFNRFGNWHPDDTWTIPLWERLAQFMAQNAGERDV